jgi:hypothetical protein
MSLLFLCFSYLVAHLFVNLCQNFRIFLQICLGFVAALADSFTAVLIERAGFLNNAMLRGEVQDVTKVRNTFVIHDIELGDTEWRRDFVFDNLDLGAVADEAALSRIIKEGLI